MKKLIIYLFIFLFSMSYVFAYSLIFEDSFDSFDTDTWSSDGTQTLNIVDGALTFTSLTSEWNDGGSVNYIPEISISSSEDFQLTADINWTGASYSGLSQFAIQLYSGTSDGISGNAMVWAGPIDAWGSGTSQKQSQINLTGYGSGKNDLGADGSTTIIINRSDDTIKVYWDGSVIQTRDWDSSFDNFSFVANKYLSYSQPTSLSVRYIKLEGSAAPDTSTPSIFQNSYNHSTGYDSNNQSAWQTNTSTASITYDGTPTIRFNTNVSAQCRIGVTDSNWTTMGNTRDCATTNGTIQICSVISDDLLTPIYNSVYLSCANTNLASAQTFASTSGALNVSFNQFYVNGTTKDSSDNDIDNSFVFLINQSDLNTLVASGNGTYAVNAQVVESTTGGVFSFLINQIATNNYLVFGYQDGNETRAADVKTFVEVAVE